jgi:Kdo2-lipid IVA lauroyltransferase/acyltransferase
MKAIPYYLTYLVLRFFSLLPLPVLYLVSDFLRITAYYLVGYRKKVVYQNLRNSFPELSEDQLHAIALRFYRHLAEVVVETIKAMDYTPADLRKRIHLVNPELLDELYKEKRNIILVASHYGNWEWLMGLAGATPYHTLAVYKPLKNQRVDKYIKKIRTKAGTELVPMRWVLKNLNDCMRENKLTLSLFVADQSPVRDEAEYWTRFLNQDTAVFIGIEKIAIRYDQVVLFSHVRKVKRGYYSVELIPVSLKPKESKTHEITDKHLELLESLIHEDPALWLWSHRRWKLKKPEANMEIKNAHHHS